MGLLDDRLFALRGVGGRAMGEIHQAYVENQDALRQFLRRFYKRKEDIEDAAQEAFLRAFTASLERKIDDPKAFLFRIARNYAIDQRRLIANKSTGYLADVESPSVLEDRSQPRADDRLASKEKLILLIEAVLELPPQCRRVFVMRKFEGKSIKDIAETLGVSVSSIDKHIATGLVKCRHYLNSRGYQMNSLAENGERKRTETRVSATTNKRTIT